MIVAKYNLDKTFAMFNVTGTPEEIKSQLESIRQDYMDLSKDLFLGNGISSEMWEEYRKEAIESINEVINKFDKGLEDHQKTYQTYIEGMIKYDSEYSDEYANILQKRSELESAQNSGNEEEIQKAKQNFMDAINDAIEASGANENIKKYFQSLYPELQAEFSDWNFEFSLKANTDGLADIAKEIGEKYTATDLLGIIDDEFTVIADSAFNSLIDKAIEYGVCTDKSAEEVQKLIDLLIELGIVQDNVNGDTFNVDPTTLSTTLTNSQDSLDKFQSSVKSAADAYTTLLTGNYSSSELLDSIQAITKAASDMGGSIDWESIATSGNPLQAIQDAIESVSESYADSVLSGARINTDSRFGQMLANIVQEAYKSEAALDSLNTQIDSLQSAYNNLTDIVSAYNETGYITFDQLQTLLAMEPQYLSCLIDENGQLQLNQESMMALANQRLDDAEAQAVQQAISELGQIALQDEKVAVEENAAAFNNAVNDLAVYNEELANTISEASVASSVIRDLNAAISGAESDGATDTQIDTVLSNLNTKLQLIKNTRLNLSKSFGGILGGKSSSSSSSKSEFSETVDYFERRVEVLDNALSHLDATMDNIAGSFGKNNLIDAELGINEEKFNNYTDALSMYTQKANEAFSKLPSDIASKVKDGAVALTDFIGDGNKDVVEAIKEYESWADKIADCQQELAELQKAIRQLELDKFQDKLINCYLNQHRLMLL